MKKIIISIAAVALVSFSSVSCIEEVLPQSGTVTSNQVAEAPGSYDLMVQAVTSTLCGKFLYGGNDKKYGNDFGLPAFYLIRDVMGQDMAYPYQNWFTSWYTCSNLGPSWANTQRPWTLYYGWIKSCNNVISLAGSDPGKDYIAGAGIAYAMRAYYYMDLARMFAQKPYTVDKESETVPIITESTSLAELAHNPRATNSVMWDFIISDLDKAEKYLADYKRGDVYTPDVSVVYGLKARAYLEMGEWAKAKEYAGKAKEGYTIMDEAAYTDWDTGFNTPNSSWMLGMTYKSDDPNILINDGDSSWGSMMCMEINPSTSGCGYAANYGQPFLIDRHLYETVPATDWRKKCYVDFEVDDLAKDDAIKLLSKYSKHPDWLYNLNIQTYEKHGGMELKFRTAGGEEGRNNQYVGFCVAVPMMRVEEMYLIEAEAAGMLNESEGIQLLTAFAKTRDENFVYGMHNEAYGNTKTSAFVNEVWWQRRIEFWGEGLATFDIKRLQKGIIRSYAGSNHADLYRWNSDTTPQWMNFCIVQTETNYNFDCTNNPDPIAPVGNSPEYSFQ